eukprot:UN03176
MKRECKLKQEKILKMKSMKGKLEMRSVDFAYPTVPDKLRLKNLSLTAEPGKVVALVGPSGGGKSSIVKLFMHLYNPTKGEVLVDDTPVENICPQFLHQKMTIVQQEPVLFARTIKDNITYGMDPKDYKLEDVVKAAKMDR